MSEHETKLENFENKYIIKKYDIVLNDASNSKNIMVYFDPDLYFMKLCRENGYRLLCFLHDSQYENIPFFCNVSETIDLEFFIVLNLEDIGETKETPAYISFYKTDNLLENRTHPVQDQPGEEIVENFIQDILDYKIDKCGCRKLIWNTNSIIIIFIFSTCILISLCILGYILYMYSDS
jgi:hypothetical protein